MHFVYGSLKTFEKKRKKTRNKVIKKYSIFAMNKVDEVGLSSEVANQDFSQARVGIPVRKYLKRTTEAGRNPSASLSS